VSPAPRPESEHDAWLQEALRHAPDAEQGPPPRLRAQILDAADKAAAPRAAWANPAGWFAALAGHPVWAGGFAALFVATIVVALWSPWSGMPETTIAEAPAAAPATTAPEPADVESERTAPGPEKAEAKMAEARRDAVSERQERGRSDLAKARTEVAAAPPLAPPPALPSVANKSTSQRAASAEAPSAQVAAEAAGADAARPGRSGLSADSALGRATGAAAAPAAPAAAPPMRAEDAAPLTAPRRGLRTEPDQWTWQRGGNEPAEPNDAVRDWLERLDAATEGRWQVIRTDPPGTRVLGTLTLLRDGRIHTILRLESDGVSRRGSVRVRAPLDPATASALAGELRQLAP
jgi:hypothetical protein